MQMGIVSLTPLHSGGAHSHGEELQNSVGETPMPAGDAEGGESILYTTFPSILLLHFGSTIR